MSKKAKVFFIVLCAALILSTITPIAYRIYHNQQQNKQVFDCSFGTKLNLYANFMGSYLIDNPKYCVTDSGAFYTVERPDSNYRTKQIGQLAEFGLNENNFDNCISGASWTAMNTGAVSIRSHTVRAWKCTGDGGSLFYILLQDNGDVILACGQQQSETRIFTIYLLNRLGSDDIFFNKYT